MTVHSLSPGFIEIQYVYSNLLHKMRLPCQPVAGWVVGTEPNLTRKDAGTIAMSAGVDALITLLKPLFQNTTEFTKAEAWFYPTGSDDPIWVYTHPIGVVGTAAGANVSASQLVITYRTQLGNISKQYLLEGTFTPNVRNSYPFGAGTTTNLSNYMIGIASWITGRDNAVLVVPMWATTKTNDKIRKIRLSM